MNGTLSISPEMQRMLALVLFGVFPKEAHDNRGQQATNKAGLPKWIVKVISDVDGATYEIGIAAAKAPDLQRFQPVTFDGLVVGGSTNGLWWSARTAETVVVARG